MHSRSADWATICCTPCLVANCPSLTCKRLSIKLFLRSNSKSTAQFYHKRPSCLRQDTTSTLMFIQKTDIPIYRMRDQSRASLWETSINWCSTLIKCQNKNTKSGNTMLNSSKARHMFRKLETDSKLGHLQWTSISSTPISISQINLVKFTTTTFSSDLNSKPWN